MLNEVIYDIAAHIGSRIIRTEFAAMLAHQERELELYDGQDADGLLREGFLDEEEYRKLCHLMGKEPLQGNAD